MDVSETNGWNFDIMSGKNEDSSESSIENLATKFFSPPPVTVHVEFGAQTHLGHSRSNNEDHYAIVRRSRSREVLKTNLPPEALPPSQQDAYAMVVADGVGGESFGELASMFALSSAWELASSEIKWPVKVNPSESQELLDKLELYPRMIDQILRERAQKEPKLLGMATTFTCAYTVGLDAFIAHVGDSRAYLFRDGAIRQLTRDHTVGQDMVDAGVDLDDSPRLRRMRSVLTNWLGGHERKIFVETHHIKLEHNDRLLLCTDGLTDLVTDEQIQETLAAVPNPEDASQQLVEAALGRGGRDNITIVVATYSEERSM